MFRGFKAILFKEFTIVFRDPTALFFMLFPPLIQIIAFGFALDMDVKHMAMVVLDEDQTVESRRFVKKLVNTESFRVVQEVQSVNEMMALIRRGKAMIGVQIPPDFTRQLRAGRKAQVQVLIDGSNSNTALQGLNTALAVAFRESLGILLAQTGQRELPSRCGRKCSSTRTCAARIFLCRASSASHCKSSPCSQHRFPSSGNASEARWNNCSSVRFRAGD